jgi:tetratricopeptide (TPR) repeat protein
MLISMGRGKEGLAEIRRALKLDPLAPSPNNALCFSLYYARQYDEAIRQCRQTLDVFPDYLEPYYGLGFIYASKKLYPEAVVVLEKAMAMTGNAPPAASILAYARAQAGNPAEARQRIADYTRGPDVSPVMLALLYVGVGDRDRAFRCLDRAVEQRTFASDSINVNPLLDSYHSDPRWAALVRKMNLSN